MNIQFTTNTKENNCVQKFEKCLLWKWHAALGAQRDVAAEKLVHDSLETACVEDGQRTDTELQKLVDWTMRANTQHDTKR